MPDKMTGVERMIKTIQGEISDRVPVLPQSFWFSAQHCGIPMSEFRASGENIAEVLMKCCLDFDYDGVMLDTDTCVLAEAMGSVLWYPEEEPCVVKEYALKSLEDVDKLKVPDPYKDGRLYTWLDATRIMRKEIGDKKFIIGRADQGPYGLAFLVRGPEQLMLDLITAEGEDRKRLHYFLDICRQAGERFAIAQAEAGAHGTTIGDGASGPDLLSPEMYMEFSWPYEKKYFETVHKEANDIPIFNHICGNTTSILQAIVDSGADVFEFDWQVPIEKAKKIAGDKMTLFGNLDTSAVLVLGNPDLVEEKCKELIRICGPGGRFILSSGCMVSPETPEEHIVKMVECAKKYGIYRSDGTIENFS